MDTGLFAESAADACASLGAAGTCSICLTESGMATPETAVGLAMALVLLGPLVLRVVGAIATAVAARRKPPEGDPV